MTHALNVTALDIHGWADRLPARSQFPRVIYRLIRETVEKLDELSFPSDEDVQWGGWDGRVGAAEGNQYVPVGASRWEVKVSKNPKSGADEDYEKRTEATPPEERANMTFVFVTMRRWSKAEEWAKKKRETSDWHDVRAYNAGDLEKWLNLAPATLTWLSESVGKRPVGVRDLQVEYSNWAGSTNPRIPSALLCSGRQRSIEEVHEWLRGNDAIGSIRAETPDEAVAFFAACVELLDPETRERVLAKTVVVHERATWDEICSVSQSLVLVSRIEDAASVTHARERGHRVLVPLGVSDPGSQASISIPQLAVGPATDALANEGLDRDEAARAASLARRSLRTFQRRYALSPETRRPEWSDGDAAQLIGRVMLAASWSASNVADQVAVSMLSDESYDKVDSLLRQRRAQADPPARLVRDFWVVTSVEDAFDLLAPTISPAAVEAFEVVLCDVLDPRPSLERLLDGRDYLTSSNPYSGALRRGLANTLAIASSRWPDVDGTKRWQEVANAVVGSLLVPTSEDWIAWASLSGSLSTLAEAAPDVFLSAAEAALDSESDAVTLLNLVERRNEHPFLLDSPRVHLIFALQRLAWSSDHLGRVALILARLASAEPDGKHGNSAQSALRGIFLDWCAQTSASLEHRMAVIDSIRPCEPEVAWRLLVELLPAHGGVGEMIVVPEWRDWAADRMKAVSTEERVAAAYATIERLVSDAGISGARWVELSQRLYRLPGDLQEKVLEGIRALDTTNIDSSEKAQLWHGLRSEVSRHRSLTDSQWALPESRLGELEELMTRLEPESLHERLVWLFGRDYEVKLPEGHEYDSGAYESLLTTRRVEAIRIVMSEGGVEELSRFAQSAPEPGLVGAALDDSGLSEPGAEEEAWILNHLAGDNEALSQFARGFSYTRARRLGVGWVEGLLGPGASAELSSEQAAGLLICQPYDRSVLTLLGFVDTGTRSAYWRGVNIRWVDDRELAETAATALIDAGRPSAACGLLSMSLRMAKLEVSPSLVASALIGHVADAEPRRAGAFDVDGLLDYIYRSDEIERDTVLLLEWQLRPLDGSSEEGLVYERLSEDPGFFASCVAWMCGKAADDSDNESVSDSLASRAHDLLHSWNGLPGKTEGEGVNLDVLLPWVESARKLCATYRVPGVGDSAIGEVLSRSPGGEDGCWPHESVRSVIEQAESSDLDAGVLVGVLNSRGGVFRDPYAGGTPERALVDRFEEHVESLRKGNWPRTSTILKNIRDSYSRDAERRDEEADLRAELGWL